MARIGYTDVSCLSVTMSCNVHVALPLNRFCLCRIDTNLLTARQPESFSRLASNIEVKRLADKCRCDTQLTFNLTACSSPTATHSLAPNARNPAQHVLLALQT